MTGPGPDARLLWLLRHAKAAADPPPGGTDHERPLAPRGRRDAAALGQHIPDLGFTDGELPATVLCSTSARTTQTAERAMARLDVPVALSRRLYYGAPADVLAEVQAVDDSVRSVMVVGHNPATHELAVAMLADEDTAGREALEAFPTCALAVFRLVAPRWQDVAEGSAVLAGFFTPPY
jgi:phosphohistidine phosphatase